MISSIFLVLFYLTNLSFCDERGPRVKRIVGGIPAAEPPSDDPTIFTNFAGRSARVQGVIDYPHYVFRGIKFAYPPTGKNRFLRPREKLLDGLINATYYAPPCIQPRPGTNQVIGSEDCLALNIFTPELPTGTEGLPVVVWIHGGGFRYGSASQYGVRHLVGKRLVVVTIQYRLGSLGFISSGTKHLPGNVALWDMALAVQWIRNYIGFFGGNPYRINVMGHGTGASSVLMIALSNIAKGIPAGVIAMSGTAVSSWAVDNTPQHTAYNIANQNGCPTADPLTMVKCLQTLPPESIIRGDSQIEFTQLNNRGFMAGLSGGLGSAPVTEGANDGRSLPGIVLEDAMDEMQSGKTKGIPLLTGICKDETKRAVKGPLKDDVLKKLNTIPNFLNTHLIQNLRKLIPLKIQINLKEIKAKFEENFQKGIENLENIIGKLVPPNFSNYVKLRTGKLVEALDKVADVTNDALFNVPAFLTADTWSIHGAPTYLYSFDHFGKNKKGHTFLKGSPLVGNDTHFVELNDTVAHGDDLAYLFDAYDVEGNPLEHDNLTADDIKVREIFTQMIADFARYGVPKVNDKPASPFNAKKNNFIKITSSPSLSNNFKFCEMALWCNIAERLKSTTCEFLKALDTSFKNMQNFVNGLKNANLSPEKIVEHINMLKNLTGQGINIFNQTGLANLSPDKVFKEINEKIKNVSLGVHSLLPPHEHNGFDILKIFDKKDQKDPKQNGFNLIPNIFEKKDPNQNGFHLLPNIFEKKPESKPQSVITGGFLNLFDVKQDSMPKPQQSTPVPVPNLLPNVKIETPVNSNPPQVGGNKGPNTILFPPDV
ncbi:liver carboxylesterase 1 [Diabrotica undecimpunctata]|uniref:liver carboxylesterase 1 n=1 Tax=Diabrotica undecimpunctata TaxID=50387 RepID=UPI003B63E663